MTVLGSYEGRIVDHHDADAATDTVRPFEGALPYG